MESRWFDCGTGYCVLVMDPATSNLTWEQVAERAAELAACGSPQVVDGVLYVAPWGYEEPRGDETAKAIYIEQCRVETVRLAELALKPPTPATVTLLS